MTTRQHIPVLILIGRPAAGKSEIIAYLKSTSPTERLSRFGIGPFTEVDDFPMLWAWFEEDRILADMGLARLHTDADGYFSSVDLWNVLIRRLDLEYRKLLADNPQFHDDSTAVIEFSRGSEHGGYASALPHLSDEAIERASILYLDVSYEESLRKNRRRFNPDRPHSILEHGLPDDKLERLYGESDWHEIAADSQGYLSIRENQVPYVVFPNEDDVTTPGGDLLGARLEECLGALVGLHSGRHQ